MPWLARLMGRYSPEHRERPLSLQPSFIRWVRLHHGLKDHEGLIENFIRVLVIDHDQSIVAGTFDGGVFRQC